MMTKTMKFPLPKPPENWSVGDEFYSKMIRDLTEKAKGQVDDDWIFYSAKGDPETQSLIVVFRKREPEPENPNIGNWYKNKQSGQIVYALLLTDEKGKREFSTTPKSKFDLCDPHKTTETGLWPEKYFLQRFERFIHENPKVN